MSEQADLITKAREHIQSRSKIRPQIAVILGSGLGSLADEVDVAREAERVDAWFDLLPPRHGSSHSPETELTACVTPCLGSTLMETPVQETLPSWALASAFH